MPYIAGQRLLIAGTYREGGEPVPEAETEQWRTLHDLVATGHLVWVDETPTKEPESAPSVYRPEPTPEPEEPEPYSEEAVAAVEAEAAELEPTVEPAPPPKPKPTPRKRTRSKR